MTMLDLIFAAIGIYLGYKLDSWCREEVVG